MINIGNMVTLEKKWCNVRKIHWNNFMIIASNSNRFTMQTFCSIIYCIIDCENKSKMYGLHIEMLF